MSYDAVVLDWIPVPGSAKARLIDAALHTFEQEGYERAAVTDLAAKAGVTTGALYHHFGSKLGLYTIVRADLERRITDRMLGAADGAGEPGRPAVRTALLVGFDAAVRFNACRILGEPHPHDQLDPIRSVLATLVPEHIETAAAILAAAWRAALLAVADGAPVESGRAALDFALPPHP